MDHSYAQSLELTCPKCGHKLTTEVWVIVDAAARPDLLEGILQGMINGLSCQQCDNTGQADAPLLVYRPGEEPPLIFSPSQRTNQEQNEKDFSGSLFFLRESLGEDWQDSWLEQIKVLPRQVL